jgi:monoamine oxidase
MAAEQRRIEGGYSLLVQFLADKARTHGAVLLNGIDVRGVRWRRGHVEVDTLRGGMPETFAGDAAIITLPLGVLKAGTVRFEPSVSEKREAINGIEFGHVG